MKNIQIKVLNPWSLLDAEQMLATTARITQRSEKIADADDFMKVFEKEHSQDFLYDMCDLPHPTIQKFGLINVAVIGASRRFLAQITRHQNEIKFMSGSLQYSDYSKEDNKTDFVIPYNYIDTPLADEYIKACKASFDVYSKLVADGKELNISDAGDAAGYAMPQGMRNVLIMSATPYQWKYMIGLRSCNRNTTETQYVLLKIWEQLFNISPAMFGKIHYGCMDGACKEGKMACINCGMKPLGTDVTPQDILADKFSKIYTPDDTKWTRDAMIEAFCKTIDQHYAILSGKGIGFNVDKFPHLKSEMNEVLKKQFGME